MYKRVHSIKVANLSMSLQSEQLFVDQKTIKVQYNKQYSNSILRIDRNTKTTKLYDDGQQS